jgi:hypothetical protein
MTPSLTRSPTPASTPLRALRGDARHQGHAARTDSETAAQGHQLNREIFKTNDSASRAQSHSGSPDKDSPHSPSWRVRANWQTGKAKTVQRPCRNP